MDVIDKVNSQKLGIELSLSRLNRAAFLYFASLVLKQLCILIYLCG